MKEYCIYIRKGDGRPYRLKSYDSLIEAQRVLYEMVKYEEEREKPYYVDNDFFNNTYNLAVKLKYFRLEEREVTNWSQYSNKNTILDNDKIIFIKDFVK